MKSERLMTLDYVVLPCSDLAAMRRFYSDILGLVVTYARGDWIEFKLEGVSVALRSRTEPLFAESEEGRGAVQLAFRVAMAQVDAWFQKLSASGVSMIDPPRDQTWGHRTFYFTDPEGNVLEVYGNLKESS